MTTEHTLEKDKMEALKAVADANMKVSEAKAALSSLKGEEAKYLAEREKAAIEMVQRAIDGSEELLRGVYANLDEVKALEKSVSELAGWIIEAHNSFKALMTSFEGLQAQFEKSTDKKLAEIEVKRRENDVIAVRIRNDREALARKKVQMAEERRKLDDDRATLDRAINRLKQGKI